MPDYSIAIILTSMRVLMGLRLVFSGWGLIIAGPDTAKSYTKDIAGPLARFFQKLAGYKTVEYLNKWGMFIAGLGLVFGLLTRLSAYAAIFLMVVCWLTRWPFKEGIVTEHIVYIPLLLFLAFVHAGVIFGFDNLLLHLPAILKLFTSPSFFPWIF